MNGSSQMILFAMTAGAGIAISKSWYGWSTFFILISLAIIGNEICEAIRNR